jgi:glycine hydroxymethyltransferase
MEKENFYNRTLEEINKVAPEVGEIIEHELIDQRSYLKMIASENYCSPAVMACQATILTDKYSEGYPNHRYYAGCGNIDELEELGQEYACKLFNADHAYLQPSTGSDCNLMAYWAILKAEVIEPLFKIIQRNHTETDGKVIKTYSDLAKFEWDAIREECHNKKLLGMDYYSGGHLTHGYRQNISAQMFDVYSYGVGDDGLLDYDSIEEMAVTLKPLILLAGYSAYPRKINFKRFREIADKCGAVLMVDMAHFAGLVAGKIFTGEYNPVEYADIVTTTTHKTFRGPRGGMILCRQWLADYVDNSCPTCNGGQLPQVLASKVVALKEAMTDEYKDYAQQIVKNSNALADTLMKEGIKIQTNGSDNHIVLIDVSTLGLNGRQAEYILRECHITTNRNALPNDPNGPWYTSGVRLGVSALTTLGMKEEEMRMIGTWIAEILKGSEHITLKDGGESKNKVKLENKKEFVDKVTELLEKFPAYKELTE